MRSLAISRRGGPDALAFGDNGWNGARISQIEGLPRYLAALT
jgi:hypothetical protein